MVNKTVQWPSHMVVYYLVFYRNEFSFARTWGTFARMQIGRLSQQMPSSARTSTYQRGARFNSLDCVSGGLPLLWYSRPNIKAWSFLVKPILESSAFGHLGLFLFYHWGSCVVLPYATLTVTETLGPWVMRTSGVAVTVLSSTFSLSVRTSSQLWQAGWT